MKTRKSFKRVLAMLLTLALVLSNVMVSGVLAAETELAPPADVSRVVFVNSAATGTGDGLTPENAFTTLEAAFEYLDDAAGDAVIVICGTVYVSASYNTDGASTDHDGVYYITGKYGSYDYSASAVIEYNGTARANLNYCGQTHYSNVELLLSSGKNVMFYSGDGITLGENVKCTLTGGGVFSIYGGAYHAEVESTYIKLSSGKIGTVMAVNDKQGVAGDVEIVIGGSAEITSNISLGYSKPIGGGLTFTMNGGTVNELWVSGRKSNSIQGDVVLNLNAGTVTTMGDRSGSSNVTVNGSVTVNLSGSFVDESGNYGGWEQSDLTWGAESTQTLNINGWSGTLSNNALAGYSAVNITGNADITYTSALTADTAVNVESGSSLRLGGNADATGLTVTGEGTVKYGMPVASVVYVNGGVDASGDGSTAETAVKTLAEAYALMDKEAGGTIIVCGDTAFNADYSTYGIAGTVILTSKAGDTQYDASLLISGTSALSDVTVMENLDITLAGSGTGSIFLYTGMDVEIKDTVTVTDPEVDSYGRLKLMVGKNVSTSGLTHTAVINGGTYHTIFCGTNTTAINVGSIDLTVGGNTVVTSNVQVSPNKGTAENITLTVTGNADINCIYNSGGTNPVKSGDITVNLVSGTVDKMTGVSKKTPTINSFTLNLHGGVTYGTPLGSWTGVTVTTGALNLNLVGISGKLADGVTANYTSLNVTGSSNVEIAETLPESMTVSVEAGSTLTLSGYESREAAEAAGVVFGDISGNLLFAGEKIEYLDVVYLDGTLAESGDGKTAETAVDNFADAFKLIDPEKGATIVLCGELRITSQVDLAAYNVSGKVILTSVYDGVDYRAEKGAKLTYVGDAQNFGASGNMVMENMVVNMESTAANTSQFIYTGEYLHIADTVTTTGTGRWKIFVSNIEADPADNCVGLIEGGTYYQVFMGSNKGNTGDATLTIDKNASVISNACMGGNSSNTVNNVTFNMKGGYVKVIYDIGNGGTVKGDVVMNLTGGNIVEMRDYNGKSGIIIEGDIIVNVGSGFGTGSAQFGVWSDGAVTVKGEKILNLLNYEGGSINSLGNYDVVNIFGGEVPAGFDISADASGKLLRVHDYTGLLGLDLGTFEKIQLTGTGSYMTFLGEVPAGIALIADDGCTMLIRASKNPGATLADWPITEVGTGKVLLDEAVYTGLELVLDVTFDDATTADLSGKENNGTITGTIQGVEGFDGGTAVYLRNRPGAEDYQYITFENLNGIDISKDNFTISFWYHTLCGGNNDWSGGATTTGTQIDMNSYGKGIVYSNQDTAADTSGLTAVQYNQNKFFTTGVTGADGTHYDKDGIRTVSDDAWHMVTVTYDREGFYKVYADGELAATVDISGQAGQQLGVNSLVLGADINGQFGMRNAYIDNVKIYSGVMNPVDVQANYIVDSANKLINDVITSVSELGSEYDPYRADILADVETAIAAMEGVTAENYVTAANVHSALKAEYEAFMAEPEALLTVLLLSDIHITTVGDTNTQRLEAVLQDLVAQGIEPDAFINAGDFADNSTASAMQAAFDATYSLLDQYLPNTVMIAAHGNHEVAWDSETANYKTSIPVYYENVMNRLQTYVAAGKATVDSENYDETQVQVSYGYTDPAGNVVTHNANRGYSYGVTVNGEDGKPAYHFLVLNTDYVDQTGSSKLVLNPDGSYSAAGNYLDPIRHGCKFLDDTLVWLDTQMAAYAEDGLPIFVVNHFPFIDTAPLSYYSEVVIGDNSIGMYDSQVRSILASYDNVFTFSGHLHHNFGIATILDVVDEATGNSFTQVNMPGVKGATRAYGNLPTGWIMYVYEDEVVFRARDYSTGEWLPWYDVVVPLTEAHVHELTKVDAVAPTCTADGNIEHYTCSGCDAIFADAEGTVEITDTVDPATGHTLSKVDAMAPTPSKDGCIEHYICEVCGKLFADAEGTIEVTAEDVVIPATGSVTDPTEEPTGKPEDKPADGSPATGESVRTALWFSLAAISMLAVIALTLLRRRNRA